MTVTWKEHRSSCRILIFLSLCDRKGKKGGGVLVFVAVVGWASLGYETLSLVWNKVPQGESGYSIIITKFNICLVYILRA